VIKVVDTLAFSLVRFSSWTYKGQLCSYLKRT